MAYFAEASSDVFTTLMGMSLGVTDIFHAVKRTKNTSGYLTRSSIMKASKDLVMTFPVIVPDTVTPDSAGMIMKAIERNCVTTLQLLFSAANLHGTDGMEVLRMWHKNIDEDKNMDDFLDAMDSIDAVAVGVVDMEAAADRYGREMVSECTNPANLQVYPKSSFSERSIASYVITESPIGPKVKQRSLVMETLNHAGLVGGFQDPKGKIFYRTIQSKDPLGSYFIPGKQNVNKTTGDIEYDQSDFIIHPDDNTILKNKADFKTELDFLKYKETVSNNADIKKHNDDMFELSKSKFDRQKEEEDRLAAQHDKERKEDKKYRDSRDEVKDKLDQANLELDREKLSLDRSKFAAQLQRDDMQRQVDMSNLFHQQLLSSDVKKCNEMVPSMLIVRFNAVDPNNGEEGNYAYGNTQQFIAGVKARIISCPSMEIIDAIRSAEKNKVSLVNLVRATTKEISFCRDFVAAIDQAKIDAKKNSRLSKTSPIWRSLQWRSNKSVMNRLRRKKGNDAGAITTLVLTSEEVNYLRTEHRIDLTIPNKVKSLMEHYNLMCFCIVDEEIEVARFFFDGEKYFQDYTFNALERETGDGNYKRMINLLSKVSR